MLVSLGHSETPFSRENGAFCQSLYQVLSEAFVGLTAVEGGCRGFLQTGNLTSFKKLKNPQAVMNNCLFLTQGGGQRPRNPWSFRNPVFQNRDSAIFEKIRIDTS